MNQAQKLEIENLNQRLGNVIREYCNKIGCGKCGLEWTEDGKSKCSATELQGKIYELEINRIAEGE